MKRRWLGLGAVVMTPLASAGCAPAPAYHALSPSAVHSAKFVSSQAGESVLVFASASVYRRRYYPGRTCVYLRRHSLENGALLASAEHCYASESYYYDYWTCEPALPGRLWCINGPGQGVYLVDTGSLQTIAVQSQFLGRAPELAGEPPFHYMRVDPQTRGFVFESRDGYPWIIDPTTLAAARFAGNMEAVPKESQSPLPWREPVLGDYEYSLDGETRVTLGRRVPPTLDRMPLHPEHTYLRGKFVRSGRVASTFNRGFSEGPIVLDDPPRLLVVEEVVDHGFKLWSVLADGTAQWNASVLPDDLLDAKVYRDTLVLVTKTKLVAVRTQDGAVVWTSPP
jgi:hypothetical protein